MQPRIGKSQLHPDEGQIHFGFPRQTELIVSKINPWETSGMYIYPSPNYSGILVTLFCIISHPPTCFLSSFGFMIDPLEWKPQVVVNYLMLVLETELESFRRITDLAPIISLQLCF